MYHSARVTARQGTARRDAQLRVAAGTESSCSRSCGLSIAPVALEGPSTPRGALWDSTTHSSPAVDADTRHGQ